MLDRWLLPAVSPLIKPLSRGLAGRGMAADTVTLVGFALGLAAAVAIATQSYLVGLVLLLLNRLCDGLDGQIARQRGSSDRGAYLDITADFIVYASWACAFAFADPSANALPAAFLLTSFMATASTFLAFAIAAARQNIERINYPSKGFYYIGGLCEGTETIAFFVIVLLLPSLFPPLAWGFAALCWITAATRMAFAYRTL